MVSPAVAPVAEQFPEHRRGVLLGAAAYGLWGVFPLYWALLDEAGTLETLAHRMLWSLVAVGVVLWFLGRRRGTGFATIRALVSDRRRLGLLALATVLIGCNWGGFIWGVTNGRVVETALGYFTGPLVSVLIGVLLLGERLRVAQWIAVGLGVVAVAVLAVGYGQVPWVALVLAFSFSLYGLVKKLADAPAVESVAVEAGLSFVPAVTFVCVLEVSGDGTFFSLGVGHTLLLIGGGLVTTVPLLAFAGAAVRIPLSMIGLLQYLAPVLQFAFGVLVFHEQMPPERWLGFAIVWLGLIILTIDGTRRSRTPRALEPSPPA
ncbi:EamA family transporter RarD [Actinophytocola gossypii]|uniref:EamA family transporter RarD n=1 Tax=Actinophytocola gossypii TaxID=2812003 RepID=A0ABT2J483_9PSEU|nr:EamA family transporter RarD [Actinophytocola gossypii]MCT2582675.1 EamA family transporter RarD [Actinophytocola gossypii]